MAETLMMKVGVDLKKLQSDIEKGIKNAAKKKIDLPFVGPTKVGSLTKGIGGAAIGGIAVGAVLAGIDRMVGFLAESSPKLSGVLKMLDRAMSIFFRPFGDFLSTLLRPTAVELLKFTRSWQKLTRDMSKGWDKMEDIEIDLGNDLKFNLKELLENAISGSFNFTKWMAEKLSAAVTGNFDFNVWLKNAISGFVTGVFDFNVWLKNAISGFVTGVFDFNVWLSGNISRYVGGFFDIGAWIKEKILSFFGGGSGGGSSSRPIDVFRPAGSTAREQEAQASLLIR